MAFALQGEAQISSCAINCRKKERLETLELFQKLPSSGPPLSHDAGGFPLRFHCGEDPRTGSMARVVKGKAKPLSLGMPLWRAGADSRVLPVCRPARPPGPWASPLAFLLGQSGPSRAGAERSGIWEPTKPQKVFT